MSNGMFHFWYDSAASLLDLLDKEGNDLVVILDTSLLRLSRQGHTIEQDDSYYFFFLKLLEDRGVKYFEFAFNDVPGIVIDNFYYYKVSERMLNSPQIVYNEIQPYIKNKDVAPFRKVYLTRKYLLPRSREDGTIKPGLKFYHDNRIDDEPLLEQYLASKGFEIVAPEEFESFEDQINFFAEVKTVASVTSSGLTNAMFMRPGTTIVEFVTPMLINFWYDEAAQANDAEEALHNLYELIAFHKEMRKLSITNSEKSTKQIIDALEHNNLIEVIGLL
jgi:hypothetical protein